MYSLRRMDPHNQLLKILWMLKNVFFLVVYECWTNVCLMCRLIIYPRNTHSNKNVLLWIEQRLIKHHVVNTFYWIVLIEVSDPKPLVKPVYGEWVSECNMQHPITIPVSLNSLKKYKWFTQRLTKFRYNSIKVRNSSPE